MSDKIVGFLGLGAMGDPMVRVLIAKGWRVVIAPRDPAKAAGLVDAGAMLVADPAAMADEVSLVVTCLPDAGSVRDVLFGEHGLVAEIGRAHV